MHTYSGQNLNVEFLGIKFQYKIKIWFADIRSIRDEPKTIEKESILPYFECSECPKIFKNCTVLDVNKHYEIEHLQMDISNQTNSRLMEAPNSQLTNSKPNLIKIGKWLTFGILLQIKFINKPSNCLYFLSENYVLFEQA